MTENTARFLKNLNMKGDAKLFELSSPVEYDEAEETKFVVVSAVIAMYSGAETYIFPANEEGEILDWGELDGSFRGGLDHEQALSNAGYEVKELMK